MSNFYVISPNVDGESNSVEDFLDEMFKNHTTMMGWGDDHTLGRLFQSMDIGDYVICAQGSNFNKKVFYAGRVSSGTSEQWPYTRKLTHFIDLRKQKIPFSTKNTYGASSRPTAIYRLKPDENAADKLICDQITSLIENMKAKKNIEDIVKLAYSRKNLILQGAPGTGKTYLTAEVALNLCGVDTSNMDRTAIMKVYHEKCTAGQIAFTTFHQSLDYEDFIEGIKPTVEDGTVSYDIEDGLFKIISQRAEMQDESNFDECYDKLVASILEGGNEYFPITSAGGATFNVRINSRNNLTLYTSEEKKQNGVLTKESLRKFHSGSIQAWAGYLKGVLNVLEKKFGLLPHKSSKDKNYVLIIDEINRGNISKIFGELITLLEADKRTGAPNTIKAMLPYSKETFSVPQNLYIIGTMNTTDRSIGSIDYAIRRRFAFFTLRSNWDVIASTYTDDNQRERAKDLYNAVANYIRKTTVDMDFEDVMVGHSYFMNQPEGLDFRWEFEILPLLLEYHKDGICSKSPLDGIKEPGDSKEDKNLHIESFINKFAHV